MGLLWGTQLAMKKLLTLLWWTLGLALLAIVALILLVYISEAQTVGPISITSAQCAFITPGENATVYVQVVGTWTGTLQPKAWITSNTPFNLPVVRSTSTVPQNTITVNGGYSTNVAGFTTFAVCGNTVASGTAKVYLNLGSAHR